MLALAISPALAQGSAKYEGGPPAGPPAPAIAAPPADPMIRELMRKAAARESENGFCARMTVNDVGDFNEFKKKPVGSIGRYGRHNAFIGKVTCGYYRIAAEFKQGGRRCIQLDQYHCQPGDPCSSSRRAECDNGFGLYQDAKQAVPARVDPGAGNALVKELMRKAEKGEKEDGFCARANWPYVGSDIHVLAASRPYASKSNSLCEYVVFSPETVKDGIRVKTAAVWHCSVGSGCFKLTKYFCFEGRSNSWASITASEHNFCR